MTSDQIDVEKSRYKTITTVKKEAAPLFENLNLYKWDFSPYASQPSQIVRFGTNENVKHGRTVTMVCCRYGVSALYLVVPTPAHAHKLF
jgi:hypothetical protein